MVGSVNQDEFEEIVKLQGSSPHRRTTIVRDEPDSLLAKVLQRIYQYERDGDAVHEQNDLAGANGDFEMINETWKKQANTIVWFLVQ